MKICGCAPFFVAVYFSFAPSRLETLESFPHFHFLSSHFLVFNGTKTMAISTYTWLKGIRSLLQENPLPAFPISERVEKSSYKVIARDHPHLPTILLQIWSHPHGSAKVSQCAIRGRRRRLHGIGGWHLGTKGSEKKLRIDCVDCVTPLEAVDKLILRVQPLQVIELNYSFKSENEAVKRQNRAKRSVDTKTKRALLKEEDAIYALRIEEWRAIDEKQIIRALLVPPLFCPAPPLPRPPRALLKTLVVSHAVKGAGDNFSSSQS